MNIEDKERNSRNKINSVSNQTSNTLTGCILNYLKSTDSNHPNVYIQQN